MNALNRRVQGLEEDLEKTVEKLVAANTKLDKAGTAADDSERAKKVFENKAIDDDKRIAGLEKELKEAREQSEVFRGSRRKSQPTREVLQGTDQNPHCKTEASRGKSRICRQICPEAAKGG